MYLNMAHHHFHALHSLPSAKVMPPPNTEDKHTQHRLLETAQKVIFPPTTRLPLYALKTS